jgi:murein DD-endopeptidase MepM/ murein hydrolase activator NlpD
MLRTLVVALSAGLVVGVAPAAAAPPPAAPGWAPPLPVPLRVTRAFTATERYGPGHRGVDVAAPVGALVRSPGAGTVRFAGPVAGHGVVSVDSAGLRFSYEPVSPGVRAGQRVGTGTALGRLVAGHPGCSAPPGLVCLHWGVRDGERYLDPLRPVRVRVRLLPLLDR